MTSSPTSSSTSTMSSSTSSSSTLSKYNFDPFAVHPFTSCVSSNPDGNATTVNHNRSNPLYAYPYRQPLGDNHTPHTPIPSPLATSPITHQQSQSSPPGPYAYMPPRPTGIFVPFRQETSSPELSDVLKSKSTSTSNTSSTTSKTYPNNTAPFIPAAPPMTFSGSRKH